MFYEETEAENKIKFYHFYVCHLSQTDDGIEYVYLQPCNTFAEASELFWEYRQRTYRDLCIYSEILAK